MLVVALGLHKAVALVLSVGLYMVGMGMALPQAQAGALMPFPDRAGAASSLIGLLDADIRAMVGAILGHMLGAHGVAVGDCVRAAGVLRCCLWTLTRGMRAAGRRAHH